jgi:protoporphyrinogen/coproporphyrinogen III oxidase
MGQNRKKVDVAIIGGGLTGLTTAFYLKKAGVDFVLIEEKDRLGGVINTISESGFTVETGPNTGVLSHPEVIDLFDDLGDACQIEEASPNVNTRLIWKGDRWHKLPSGIMSGISTPLFTFTDKLRLLGEPFRKKGTNPDENLAELVKRRIGKSFLNYAVDPFILGIYAGDPEYLIPRYALPKLYNLEQNYGSFIGGAIKKGKEQKTEREKRANRKIFSVKGGLSNLIDSLSKYIGSENIMLGCKGITITYNNFFSISIENGSTAIEADKVITTTGSYPLPQMLSFLTASQKERLNNLEYAKVIQLAIGFNEWKGIPLNAFGGLVPSIESKNLLGILFISSFLDGRAPKGGALMSVFVGGYRKPQLSDLPDDELLKLITPDIKQMLGIDTFSPDLLRIFRYKYAIPQYGVSTGERIEAISEIENQYTGLTIGGNLHGGIGMADRIKQGRHLAEKIALQITQKEKGRIE